MCNLQSLGLLHCPCGLAACVACWKGFLEQQLATRTNPLQGLGLRVEGLGSRGVRVGIKGIRLTQRKAACAHAARAGLRNSSRITTPPKEEKPMFNPSLHLNALEPLQYTLPLPPLRPRHFETGPSKPESPEQARCKENFACSPLGWYPWRAGCSCQESHGEFRFLMHPPPNPRQVLVSKAKKA